jgi:hypothetical protein
MISGLYSGYPGACLDDYSCTLMAGNAGKGGHGDDAVENGEVRMAYSCSFIFD